MKKFHQTLNYKGFGVHDSFCYLDIFKKNDNYLVIMTEPDDDKDSGTSVTNANIKK